MSDGIMSISLDGITFKIRQEDYVDVTLSLNKARQSLKKKGFPLLEGVDKEDLVEKKDETDEQKEAREKLSFQVAEQSGLISMTTAFYIMIARIIEWSGVKVRGQIDPPCTEENKLVFFGKRYGLADKLMSAIQDREAEEEKNFEASPVG